jgi:hypothetical protein
MELGTPLESIGIMVARAAEPGWALLRARGYTLERARATVRRYYTGQLLEQARVILRGYLSGVAYGGEYEPITAGIERSLRQGGMIPGPGHRIDATTWPRSPAIHRRDESATGWVYPVVIGCPGALDGETYPVSSIVMSEYCVPAHRRQECTGLLSLGSVWSTTVIMHPSEGSAVRESRLRWS